MKKIINNYSILIITIGIILLLSFNFESYAKEGGSSIDFGSASDFISAGETAAAANSIDLNPIGESFSVLGNVLTYIGVGILVGATGYMGIMYMISPPEKQAKLKQQLIGLVVSAIVIFGAYGIWELIVRFLGETIGGGNS